LNIKQDVLKDQLQEEQRRGEEVKPKASMYCSRMLLLALIIPVSLVAYSLLCNSTKTEDNQKITLEPAGFNSTKTEDKQEINPEPAEEEPNEATPEPAEEELHEAQFEKQQASEFRAKGEVDLANLHEEAASILGQNDASKQLDLASIYFGLGYLYLYMGKGDSTRAEEHYVKCLTIRQEVLPANHPHLASIYNNLGNLYRSKED
jgi:tetratricopeptide (TPR) repeat protein